MKKKQWLGLFFLLISALFLQSQGTDSLARGIADKINRTFQGQFGISAAIVKLENKSSLSGVALERIYQLIYSHLGGGNDNQFLDLLIDFKDNSARFDLSKVGEIQFLIYLKFTQEWNHIGAGIVIHSRRLDRVVSVSYVDSVIPTEEKNLLDAREFGFSELGFSRVVEMEARKNLMDLKCFTIADVPYAFFFYPKEIQLFRVLEHGLEKTGEIKVGWPSPLYPVLHYEGKLTLFKVGSQIFLTAGVNFCTKSLLFQFRDGLWLEAGKFPFVPLATVMINQTPYLAGSPYEIGKNHFLNRMFFLTLRENGPDMSRPLEKAVPFFYSAEFVTNNGELAAVHFIDLDFQHQSLAADFVSPIASFPRRGSAIANLDNRWLAVSDYSRSTDRIYFIRIERSSLKPAYENTVAGEIYFISAGLWQALKGFWVYLHVQEGDHDRFVLQFWSKKNE